LFFYGDYVDSPGMSAAPSTPFNLATTLSVLFIYPTYTILARAIEDDGKFNWIEIAPCSRSSRS